MRSPLILALAALSSLPFASPAHAAAVTISCGSLGLEQAFCQNAVAQWEAITGHEVEVYASPMEPDEQLALYRRLLETESPDVDVYQIDMTWPGLLSDHFIDLRPYFEADHVASHFDSIISGLTRDGALLAMPWYTDAPMLYYRADLLDKYGLSVPVTWAQMTEAAQVIQEGERASGNDRFWGYVWQGKAGEALAGSALEWINSHNGGRIVELDGEITVNNPNAVKAIELAASWVGTISPPEALNYQDEDVRGVFQVGNAAFMRNRGFAYAPGNHADSKIAGLFEVAPLPQGGPDGRSAATLGGWQLAVSRYSDNPELAAELVRFLTSQEMQKVRAVEGGLAPTYPELYRDPEVLDANPYFAQLLLCLEGAVAPPSAVAGDRYGGVEDAFYSAVHAVLTGEGEAADKLAILEEELARMSRGGRW